MTEEKKTTIAGERIGLRPVVWADDEEFLIGLYYTTRFDIHQAPMDEQQKKTLSFMQFLAQRQHYLTFFPGSTHDLILLDGERVGRLWIARNEEEIVCVDISVMPEHRNFGIGTFLLTGLLAETAASRRAFNFHVLKTNHRALRLYERLNCKYNGETPTHFKMQWRPENELLGSNKK